MTFNPLEMNLKAFSIFVCFYFFLSVSAFSQFPEVGFAKSFGASGDNTNYDVEAFPNGESVTVGYYSSPFSFGIISMPHQGGIDGYVVKSDAIGNYVWAKALASNGDDIISEVSFDAAGNVFVVGEHTSTASFGGTSFINNEGKNAFVAKLDPNGEVIWSRSIGNEEDAKFTSLHIDGQGNVFAYGEFGGNLNLDGNSLVSTDVKSLFLLKLNNAGVVVWAKSMGKQFDNSSDVWVNSVGEAVITGGFLGRLILGNDTLFSKGLSDVFISKLNANGDFIWAKSFGGTQVDNCFSIIGDADNNIYCAPVYNGTMLLGGNTFVSNGAWDVLAAKFSPQGDHIWSNSFGGSDHDRSNDIQLDASGNLLVSGWFQDTMQVGPSNLISKGAYDVFVATISPAGIPLVGHSFGGSLIDIGAGLGIDAADNLYISGSFFSTNFSVGSVNLPNPSGTKMYLIKLGNSPTQIGETVEANCQVKQKTFPGYVEWVSNQNGEIAVSNQIGQIVFFGPVRKNEPIRFSGMKELLFYGFIFEKNQRKTGKILP